VQGVEEMRARMVATWTAAADRYADWVVDRGTTQGIFAAFRAALVQALAGLPAPRILDVAAANGEPSATLALALPHAHVVSTDLVPGYLELGRRRAERLGIRNITFETAGERGGRGGRGGGGARLPVTAALHSDRTLALPRIASASSSQVASYSGTRFACCPQTPRIWGSTAQPPSTRSPAPSASCLCRAGSKPSRSSCAC
jgi:SAM-dependent methyltransferase